MVAQSLGGGLPGLLQNMTAAMSQPFNIAWTDKSAICLLIFTALYAVAITVYYTDYAKRRDGEEHGSARWASPGQINAMFAQKENIILTRHVKLGLDGHKHRRNLNVLVIGGSGA